MNDSGRSGRFDVFREPPVETPSPATANPNLATADDAAGMLPDLAETSDRLQALHPATTGALVLRRETAVETSGPAGWLVAADDDRIRHRACESFRGIDGRLLAGQYADGVSALVVGYAAQAPAHIFEAGRPTAPTDVRISVDRVRQAPGSVAEMIELVPQTPFQEMVAEAGAEGGTLDALLADLKDFREDGAEGLVVSMTYSEVDLAVIERAWGRKRRKELAESAATRQRQLGRAFGFDLNGGKPVLATGDTRARRKQAIRDCQGQIDQLDRHVRGAQGELGLGIDGLSGRLEKDLRLASVMFTHESEGRAGMGTHPIDAARRTGGFIEDSSAVLAKLAGGSEGTRANRRSETPQQAFARNVVAALTLDIAGAKAFAARQPEGAARIAADLRVGQKLAVLVAYEGDVNRDSFGDTAALARYGQTLIGAAAQQNNAAAANARQGDEFFAFHLPGYSDTSLAQDLAVAKTVLAILRSRNPNLAREYEAYVVAMVEQAVHGSDQAAGVQSGGTTYDSALGPGRRALMGPQDYAIIEHNTVAGMAASGGATRIHDSRAAGFADDMAGARLARTHDITGAYRAMQLAAEAQIARERYAADFPGDRRVFLYFGNDWPDDGTPGGNAIQFALSGLVDYVDSCGGPRNPLLDPQFANGLERQGRKLGLDLTVPRPLDGLPPAGRQWKVAEWHGGLPDSLRAFHILERMLPGGFATMAIKANPGLSRDIVLATDPRRRAEAAAAGKPYTGDTHDGEYSLWHLPTLPVRFVPGHAARVEARFGHADPNWRWPEQTLVIFRHIPDGNGGFRPSPLFAHVRREIQQLARD